MSAHLPISSASGETPSGRPDAAQAPRPWSEADDEILAGDLTAALAYLTPAGGAVLTPVAPIGLRDRDAGTVTFTTSLGFGRKLDRIARNPRVALAYHARDHGFAAAPRFVLVQGTATYDAHPDEAKLVGLETRQHTGWLHDGIYAPHTDNGFRAPANKTLLLLANGYMARQGLKKARAVGRN